MDEEEKQLETETPSNSSADKSGLNPMIIGAVVIVIVLLAAGYMLVRSNKPQAGEEKMEAANGTQEESMMQENSTSNSQSSTSPSEAMATEENGIQTISVEGGMFYFKPNKITVKKGTPVKVTLTSADGNHDFVIDELNAKTTRVSTGQSTTVEFTPEKAGTFEFYCSVSNHKQMGMVGKLIVE